jgi:hypothetical protein
VTTRNKADLPLLYQALCAPPEPATAAGLFPVSEQIAAFAALLPGRPLLEVLVTPS